MDETEFIPEGVPIPEESMASGDVPSESKRANSMSNRFRHRSTQGQTREPPATFEQQLELESDSSLPEGLMDNLDLMDRVLEGKTDVLASKVIQLVMKYHINPNDPIFLILLAIGELELMMVDVPLLIEQLSTEHETRLRVLFDKYFGSNDAEVEHRYQAALAVIRQQIAEAVTELIKTTRQEQFAGDIYTLGKMMLPALGAIVLSAGLGVVGTLQYHKLKTGALLGEGKLTPQQYADLQWAQSAEGRQAKEIMSYNQGYVGKTCKADAEAMGLSLNFGERKVTSGFCVLFVDPPSKRKYHK